MIKAAGWWVNVCPVEHRPVATDVFGPFDCRQDVLDWLAEHKIQLRDDRAFFKRSVPTFIEMTDDDLGGEDYAPWACEIHYHSG